jgi:hypothetical protein
MFHVKRRRLRVTPLPWRLACVGGFDGEGVDRRSPLLEAEQRGCRAFVGEAVVKAARGCRSV